LWRIQDLTALITPWSFDAADDHWLVEGVNLMNRAWIEM